ncbi:PepSY domain-containing protein [Rhodosalinus halophilus]|uniref:PepSY domain-containing protein n=1 Tax=Rhodosalinus halophilus TaxID=2259333 RepID=A0A365U5Z3_9RHOB|nr:PepSY domain-containing protein [Rhodosalinus halophilus]RBI83787.1 PepSY domain-containing protein [Rhodosalinus halophilus]
MTRTILFTAALATATALFAVGVQASDDDARRFGDMPPRAEWMSVADLAQKLEAQGYTIREIDTEYGVYEVEMTDPNGMRVEAYLHPVTGEPVQRRARDRDWGDDD